MNRWKKMAAGLLAGVWAFSCFVPAEAAGRHKAEAMSSTIVNTAQRAASVMPRHAAATAKQVAAAKQADADVMHIWNVESKDTGGTLLFSDSPEYVLQSGILYQDMVKGDARVLYYHLNDTGIPQKVAVVLTNEAAAHTMVEVTRGGSSQPGSNYLEVGRSTQITYFDTELKDAIYVGAGERRLLRSDMDETVLQPGQLVYGVYDFHADAPVKVSVIMYPADQDPFGFLQNASVLPKDDRRLRGTFTGMDRVISSKQIYDPQKDGIVYIPLADNRNDAFRTGVDATDGSLVTDVGNYGVLYRIEIPTNGQYSTKYYLSPLGGKYAGAMTVAQGSSDPDLLLTPAQQSYFGDHTQVGPVGADGSAKLTNQMELSYLGTYHNSNKLMFEYSPPGASNLPVNLILVPDLENRTLASTAKKR